MASRSTGEGREKRVRKKTKRLSESICPPEEPAKKKRKREGAGTAVSAASGSATEHQKTREKKGSRARKLIVSYNLVKHSLKLVSTPLKELKGASIRSEDTPTPTNSWNGEGAFPRRNSEANFKNPNFSLSYLASNKKKTWKNLKQILAAERALSWRHDDPTYSSIDAPPSLKPAKKYADMSGFVAKYTDPLSGIYFSTSEEFQLIRTLPSDIIQGYLALRGKMTI